MKNLIAQIKSAIQGEVREDLATKRIYSVDASLFEVEPLAIVIPKSIEDIVATVTLAINAGVCVRGRGAATGITGGCLGPGIILDLSKYLNRILEIDWEKGFVICEPGLVQDELNAVLGKQGFRLGPDTSTGNRATIGGMLANNAAGSRSLKFGPMANHVLEVDLVLSNGNLIKCEELDAASFKKKTHDPGPEQNIYQTVKNIREHSKEEIHSHFPKMPRRVSGYNLDSLILPNSLNLSKLIAGSEGTLGIAAKIKLQIVPQLKRTGLLVVHFHDMLEGMRSIPEMLAFKPIAIEMIDRHIIEMGKQSRSVHDKLKWLIGDPETVFVIEMEAESEIEVFEALNSIKQSLIQKKCGEAHVILIDPEAMSHVWQVRKAGLGLLLSKRSYNRAIAFIEDISVSPEHLSDFMKEYTQYMKKIGKESGIYGHVGSGCLHIRPYMDVRNPSDFHLMGTIMKDITEILIGYKGTLSGEHGDGLIRSWLNPALFGEKIYQIFLDIKQAFDPKNLMNPGKIVFPEPFDSNRRLDPQILIRDIETFQDFSKEGGFALSADLCNGNGECRKSSGVMCPSFQASNDEYHTTRARAQMLRSIITGRLPIEEITGEALRDVLDLCIECKGCKKECPSQVDMAKMKAEILYHTQKEKGASLRDRIFGFIDKVNRWTSPFAKGVNSLNSLSLSKKIFSFLGFAEERSLPRLASTTFSKWAKKYKPLQTDKKVVLFNDTFTEFHAPEVGIAAVHVLESLGYQVIIPKRQCCGRTLISKGFLEPAKRYASSLVTQLSEYAREGISIVGLEPSCLFAMKDDFQGLLGYNHEDLKKLIPYCLTLDQFLVGHIKEGALPLPFNSDFKPMVFHTHCHQKALAGTDDTLKILKAIPNSNVEEIITGCCGMAGSFGYEKEHYDFSVKIAEQKLLPFLRKVPEGTKVIVNGFSCGHQIEDLSRHKTWHLAEALVSYLLL